MGTRLTALSFGLAIAAAIVLLVLPVYSNRTTLPEENGAWAIVPVMFPVVMALLPVLFRKQAVRMAAAFLMGAFALIGSFSIGLLYLPAAIVMFLAAGSHACPSGSSEKHA
ncbi:MAG: hypothetical protein P4L56_04940 [Candidatus Sulfopaludibacter sp.]|nr:hypothetical protein [Candidatus Sulfopaludibacter sp.]